MTEQRREHVRVPSEVELRILPKRDEETGWFGTVSLDLSGGGVKVAGPDALKVGDPLRLELTLPSGERIAGHARVARVERDPEHDVVHGVEIEALPERDRDTIVAHVFERQRELLRERADERP
jgi:c-di-GMP-binding flagellar brake protein YcgR